jgi:WD40 repeat protein
MDGAKAVAFSPDGRTLAVGHDSGTIRLWDVANRRQVRTMKGSRMIVCLAFSPDGRLLASGSGDNTSPPTHVWELATGRRTDLPGSGWVTFSPDGRLLAVAGGGDRLWLWDMPHRRKIATLRVADRTDFAAFSPDGKTLASGGGEVNSLTMLLWDVATRIRKRTYVIPPRRGGGAKKVVALSFDPVGRPLAVDDGNDVWDIAAGARVVTLRIAGPFGLSPAGLSPDGRTIVGISGNLIQFMDTSTGRPLASLNPGDSAMSGWQVAFTPDSSLVAVTSGPRVLLYRVQRQH